MRKIRCISVISFVVFAVMFLPLVAHSQTKAPVKMWRAAGHAPASSPMAKGVDKFCKLVEERTKGAVKITFYPSEMLMGADDQVAAVMRGSVQFGAGTPGYDGRGVHFQSPFSHPFLGLSFDDWKPLSDRGTPLRAIMEQAYDDAGLKLLSLYPYAEEVIVSARKPLLKVEDFKSLKLRVTGAAKAQAFKALGAEPVAMTGSEAAEALRKGMIEASTVDISAVIERRYFEFAKYIGRWNVTAVAETLYINKAAYNSVPKEMQDIIVNTAAEIEAGMWQEMEKVDQVGMLKAKGMTINEIPRAELHKASQITSAVRNKWLQDMGSTGVKVKEILDKAGAAK